MAIRIAQKTWQAYEGSKPVRYSQLKAFHAVALWGSFSVAADRMGLSQPAISDHIRKLEETYGVQLFIRSRQGAMLSDIGRRLYALTEKLDETETAARDLLSRARGLKVGQMVIGADAAVHILPVLARFSRTYPGVSLKLTTGNSSRLISQLMDFELDFAVVGEKPVSARFDSRLISQSGFLAFVASGHEWSGRKSVSFNELANAQLVMRETGSATREAFDRECMQRGLDTRPFFEIEGREASREAVAAGLGVGIVSEGEYVRDDRICAIAINDWNYQMGEWLVCLKSRNSLHMISSLLALADAA